ncbi:hypothetical protein BN1048_00358 [Jeotgalicoccus saudimassiliensis]|uniref:Uncharacterized protein n=1 Tax=Jeotgalicoccus saudimassiliensis TaxID=1461582 RepID=A0A078M398_9STAP|nr:hypothetical protein [Jeotgalicoccus saudimassiliensis]CDZ99231.1 hypothetical protein BN1048_00358 [Jeotgalicoccus saudimassiliensis]
MNKFYMELDNRDNGLSVLLTIAKNEGIQNLYKRLGNYDMSKFIDLTALDTGNVWSIIDEFPSEEMDAVFIISDIQINEKLLDNARNIADIDFKNNRYYLQSGVQESGILEKYKMLNINVKQKSKSYELEIVESLLREHDKNNEVISTLEREKQQLQMTGSRADDDDLEKRYLDLMEKYKQSLSRLEQLRSSKLGKMQVAYWNRKRGY